MKKLLALPLAIAITIFSVPAFAEDEIIDDRIVEEVPGEEFVDDGSIPDEILQSGAGSPEVQRDGDLAPTKVAEFSRADNTQDAGDWLAKLRKKKINQ